MSLNTKMCIIDYDRQQNCIKKKNTITTPVKMERFQIYDCYYNDALENPAPILNTNDLPLWGDEYLAK